MSQLAHALLADVGGTHTRCAVSDGQGQIGVQVFENNDFPSLEALLVAYLSELRQTAETPSLSLKQAILGVAGVVENEQVTLLNRDWSFSVQSICAALEIPHARLVNDFEALAYALPNLQPDEVRQCGGSKVSELAARCVLGPGTGIGVSSVVWTGQSWLALPGEGGHVSLAATNDVEYGLCQYLTKRFGRASVERALCGPGLSNIHYYLHKQERLPREIALAAHNGDVAANTTFKLFYDLLASFAGDVALTVGTTGGVYVAGGVINKNLQLIDEESFRQRFEAKGRYAWFLRKIPIYWVTASVPALTGLTYLHRSSA